MGMYTELYLGVELCKDTPDNILEWLACQNNECIDYDVVKDLCPSQLKGTRLSYIGGSSYYFDAMQHYCFKYDTISGSYFLTCGCNIKNYSDEIDTLLNILEPFILSIGHIGHIRYEEEYTPTLLFMEAGVLVKKRINNEN